MMPGPLTEQRAPSYHRVSVVLDLCLYPRECTGGPTTPTHLLKAGHNLRKKKRDIELNPQLRNLLPYSEAVA